MTDNIQPNEGTNSQVTEQPVKADKPLLTQEHVDAIVKARVADAYNKGRLEAMNEVEKLKAASNPPQSTFAAANVPQSTNSMSPEQINKMIQDNLAAEAQKRAAEEQQRTHQAFAHKVASEVDQRMKEASSNYSDFDSTLKNLQLDAIPEIVLLAHGVNNTGHVLYNLAKNPHKIASLQILAATQPQLAMQEMQKLSSSISANEDAAKKADKTVIPLSAIPTSSNVGAGNSSTDNADNLEAFKRKYRT